MNQVNENSGRKNDKRENLPNRLRHAFIGNVDETHGDFFRRFLLPSLPGDLLRQESKFLSGNIHI